MADSHEVNKAGLVQWLNARGPEAAANVLAEVLQLGIDMAQDNCSDLGQAAELFGGTVIVPRMEEFVFTITIETNPDNEYDIQTWLSGNLGDELTNYVDAGSVDVTSVSS